MTIIRLIQDCNNRHDHCIHSLSQLSTDFPFIKVSFTVNKGSKTGDFRYYPLNRGCSLNTVFTVLTLTLTLTFLYNDENNVKKVSFEWPHHRISSPQTQTSKPTLQDSIIHARSEGPE